MMRPTALHGAYASRMRGTLGLLGWAYPTEFSDWVEEHRAVRSRPGVFDFSFMAHFVVRGTGALPFLQRIVKEEFIGGVPGIAVRSALPFYDPSRGRVRGAVPCVGHVAAPASGIPR